MESLSEFTPTFRAPDREIESNNATSKVPDCIKELPSPDPSRQPLDISELSQEVSRLSDKNFTQLEYPRPNPKTGTRRFNVDPALPRQKFGLVTFIPAKGASPDKDGCYGVFKLRGNFETEMEADKWSENLIRNFDNFAEIDYVFVGNYFPLMDSNDIYTRSTREIDIRKLTNDTVKDAVRQKEMEEQKQIREIEERQRKLLDKSNEEEKDKSYTDLDYYIQIRVKKANALYVIDEAQKKIKEAEGVVEKVSVEISDLDEKFPNYKDEFFSRYEAAIKATGGNIKDNPMVAFMNR
jgi:hypothetical protein